jgi:hypothetical protein
MDMTGGNPMPTWIVTVVLLGIVALVSGTGAVADQSIGRTLGEAGRAIVDDSKSAYQGSRHFFVDTGRRISQSAREAYDDAKHIGPRMAEDLKAGFQGGGQAPDPTQDKTSALEKP